jgi:peptide/nickel transport system permease protein
MVNQVQIENNQVVEIQPKKSEFKRAVKVMFGRKIVLFGAVLIFIFLFLSAFGQWVAPYDPYAQNLGEVLQQPSSQHLLGTDAFGRDTLTRLIYGARISLMVGVVAVTIAGVIGIFLGLLAGYYGGWIDTIIMRIMDTLMALPPIVLMMAIAAALGGGLFNIMISLGVGMIPTYCRLMYAL